MLIKEYEGHKPNLHPTVRVAENATIVGKATLAEDVNVWNVVIGHGAIVHSCTVGDNSLIGMGATLLSGCKIGSGCIIGAGAVVAGNMTVPDNALVVGLPGKVLKPTTEEQRAYTIADAKHYVELAKKQLEAVGEE